MQLLEWLILIEFLFNERIGFRFGWSNDKLEVSLIHFNIFLREDLLNDFEALEILFQSSLGVFLDGRDMVREEFRQFVS